ncbi:MFS transporter [Crassisporium funariophilum]|nr:MFS transporter [Crassisporium funariophilum]
MKVQLTPSEKENKEYPKRFKLFLITTALCLCIFLVALDQTIITTTIPKFVDEFKLLFGKLYTFEVKRTYLATIGIFELGSLICGVAPNSTTLIVGWSIAGLGCTGAFNGLLIIIAHLVPLQQCPVYSSLISAMWGIASVAGPLLGGAFTDKVSWRWCFYINLFIGATTVIFIVIFFQLPARRHDSKRIGIWRRLKEFDLLGSVLFIPGICCLLLVLQWGGSKFAWNDRRIIALLVLFLILGLAFVLVQIWMNKSATAPPRIIKERSIWAGVIYSAGMMACFFVLLYFLPIWFQATKGVSAVKLGIQILPLIIGVVIVSIVSGGCVSYFRHYTPFMIASSVLVSVGAGLLTILHIDSPAGAWTGYQFMAGFGIGLGIQQPSMAVQNVLSIHDVSIGTVIIVFLQMLGSSICVSVGQNLFLNSLISGLRHALPALDPQTVLDIGPTNLNQQIPAQYLATVLDVYNAAIVKTFFICVGGACLSGIGSALIEWRSIKWK